MDWLIIALLVVLVVGFGVVGRHLLQSKPTTSLPPASDLEPRLEAVERSLADLSTLTGQRHDLTHAKLSELDELVDLLPKKWDDIKLDARRFYDRASYAVRSVRAELAQDGLADPAIEDLDYELRGLDGGGGEGSELRAVPDDVAGDPGEIDPAVRSFLYKQARRR